MEQHGNHEQLSPRSPGQRGYHVRGGDCRDLLLQRASAACRLVPGSVWARTVCVGGGGGGGGLNAVEPFLAKFLVCLKQVKRT